MELKNRIWMTGALEWFAFIDDEEVFLGRKNFPNPPEEGDQWISEAGDIFRIENGEIKKIGQTEPPKKYW